MTSASSPSAPAPRDLRWLRVAALVCLAEAAALLVLAVGEGATLSSSRAAVGVTTTIFFAIYAAGLALAARAIAKCHSWARAPLVLTQLIQLGLAWSFFGSGTEWVAALLAASALFVAVVLLLPSTTVLLYGEPSPGGEPKR